MAEFIEAALLGLAEAADRRNDRWVRYAAGIAAAAALIGVTIWALTQTV